MVTFSYTAPSGVSAHDQVNYTNYTVATNFGVSGIHEYKSTAAVPLVSSIVLSDGTQYSFQYEPTPSTPSSGACTPYAGTTCVTARMTSITLPTGGTITYAYFGGNNGIFPNGSTAGLRRYTPDTGSSAFWNYARTLETGSASITTVTDPTPQANQTLIQFQGIYETQRNVYSGAAPAFSTFPIPEATLQTAGLVRELQTCYNANTVNCTSTAVGPLITQRNITTHLSGASSWANSQTSQTIFKYSSTGSLTEQDDYDYGVGVPGSLLKKTAITYATLTNIRAFRQQVTVTNGSGAVVSQTNYNYGDAVTATSGTPQHTSPGGSRGNLLSVNYYTQGSTFLTKSFTYFDTGKIQAITDMNGAQTTFAYGACGNSFPTQVTEPLSLSRSMSWNCTGGVLTSVTDENGQISSTAYTTDPYFWRPNSATDATSAVTSLTYTGQTQVEAVLPIVAGSSVSDVLATVDSLGRSSLSQVRQAPGGSNFDTVETDYDIEGRPYRSTLPFQSTAAQKSSTAPGTTTAYDDMTRLQSASCGSVWSQTFSFDAFGNIAKSGSMSFSALYNPSTNRITSVGGFTPTYDANGNTLTDPSHAYTWDSAGRPVSIDSVSVTYDALGRMVEQNRSGVYTQFAYGPGGTKLATLSGSSLQKAIVPLMGGAQVVYNSAGILYYGHSDHLGSIRLGSTTSRTAAFSLAYAPYGETYATTGSTDPAFTAQRQDTVSGIYDFPDREYAIYGRWISPDPAGLGAFHLTDPQSINRYAYARNNPLSMVDPTGLCSLVETDSKEPSQFNQFGIGFSWEEEDPPSTSCIDPGAGGGGGGAGGGSVAPPGSGPDPGSGIDPGQNPGTNNGPSSGDPSNSGQGCNDASCGPAVPSDGHMCINSSIGAYACPGTMPPDVVTTPIDIETTNSPLPDTLSKPTDNSLNGLEPLINGQEQLEVGVTNRWLIPTMSVAGGVALGYLGNEVTMVGASEMGMAFTEGAGIDMLGFVGGTAVATVGAGVVLAGVAVVGEGIYYGINGKLWIP